MLRRLWKSVASTLVVLAAWVYPAVGQEIPPQLGVGGRAPDFTIPATMPVPEDGSTVSISALTGRGLSVVIAFFPKAFTGG